MSPPRQSQPRREEALESYGHLDPTISTCIVLPCGPCLLFFLATMALGLRQAMQERDGHGLLPLHRALRFKHPETVTLAILTSPASARPCSSSARGIGWIRLRSAYSNWAHDEAAACFTVAAAQADVACAKPLPGGFVASTSVPSVTSLSDRASRHRILG